MEPVYGSVERVLAPLLRVWFRWDIEGADRLPARGPVIVASNHISLIDPFFVAYALHGAGLRARFLAKAELFRNPILRMLLTRLGQIPVHRGTGSTQPLDMAEGALWRGEVVVIFPEGTVNRAPSGPPLLPLKSGMARLSIGSGVPVVPVATWGGQAVWPGGGFKRRFAPGAPVRVLVGDPNEPPGAVADRERLEALTSEVASRLAGLVEKIASAP